MKKTKIPKIPKVIKVDHMHQLQALLDVVLSKTAITGKTYRGTYEIPMNKIIENHNTNEISLKVLIIAKCEGRLNGETADNWFDSDPEHQ